jgi:hypothetical protein
MKTTKSPYLTDRRLADVISALQVLGNYTWASREAESWAKKLGHVLSAPDWLTLFIEHPEFFRVNGQWVSLRWRHGYDRNFHTQQQREFSPVEIAGLGEDEKEVLTRKALDPEQVESLMKTAIELHSRAIAHEQERRWMTPLLFGLLGVILGAVLQAALK